MSNRVLDSLSPVIIRAIVERVAQTPSGMPVIISNSFLIDQWADLPPSSPIDGGLSATHIDQIVKSVSATSDELLTAFIYNNREKLVLLNQAILTTLVRRCGFRLLERGEYHSTFVTENCAP